MLSKTILTALALLLSLASAALAGEGGAPGCTQNLCASGAAPGSFPEPCKICVSQDDPRATTLFVQFVKTNVQFVPQPGDASQGLKRQEIWTRAYGLERERGMIPGPSFVFQPGDLLQITLDNLLDTTSSDRGFNKLLAGFESDVEPNFDTDEIIEHVRSEVNLPHNPNNTNLHVHGLHVDPTQDNVTLTIIPEGDSKTNYSPAMWPFIREQIWPYRYRIPEVHLPGTHWYHAHKHGATSIHVENGMAGALIIKPNDPARALVPGLAEEHDRVLVLQATSNYGVQQGVRGGPPADLVDMDAVSFGAAAPTGATPPKIKQRGHLVTVNGVQQPTLNLRPGQLERWRFVNAAANHKSFAYLWLGKDTAVKTRDGKEIYQEVPIFLAALDGITLRELVPITAGKPLLMGPGNRADLLVQIEEVGKYVLFKNFPSNVEVVDSSGNVLPATQDQISNPYLLTEIHTTPDNCPTYQQHLPFPSGTPNFGRFCKRWQTVATGENPVPGPQKTALVPILRLEPVDEPEGIRLLEVTFPLADDFPQGETSLQGGWKPVSPKHMGGGLFPPQELLVVKVQGPPASSGPRLPLPLGHLESISPTGSRANPPAYVSPIGPEDILQSRTASFDLSGISVQVRSRPNNVLQQKIAQFTLNGRQFDLGDSIGNPRAAELIAETPYIPPLATGSGHEGTVSLELDLVQQHGLWTNQCWTNPGFYQGVAQLGTICEDDSKPPCKDGEKEFPVYAYKADGNLCDPSSPKKLSYKDVTGLKQVSLPNPAQKPWPRGVPGEPVATTAEEWVLINNSPIGHPFHIHINPFFITEVGQLSYEPFKDGQEEWVIRTVNPDRNGKPDDATTMPAPTEPKKLKGTSTLWWVVNNWWDTIIIPPHGYVKMRYWMNVPQQDWDGQTVTDNVNRYGNWVYHCHILRHEDRGMMMIVATQPKIPK